jgi:hypothetical protein
MMCDVGKDAIKDAIANIARNREVLHFLSCIARFLGHFSGLATIRPRGFRDRRVTAVTRSGRQTSHTKDFWPAPIRRREYANSRPKPNGQSAGITYDMAMLPQLSRAFGYVILKPFAAHRQTTWRNGRD